MNPEYFINADPALLKAYSYEDAQKAFDYIVNECCVEFDYPQGGCQQRAQIISLILQQKFNIDHFKLWLFSPAALTLYDCRTLYINDANQFSENNTIEWNYHVVPMININTANGIQQMVIDPSLDKNKLLSLTDFFAAIGNSNISKYTFLLPDKYFFNTSIVNNQPTAVFDGSFSNYDDYIKNDLTVEKGLASNNMAMKIFHEHVQPLQQKNDAKDAKRLNDLKAIFGNATAADLLFSQNLSGNSENTTLRYVTATYPEIIDEARTIFYERLKFWTAFTNNLKK